MLLVAPAAAAPAAADIVVTSIADAEDSAVRSVEELLANPGPDGITLREAIEATNNDPGSYTITFAAEHAGKTITLAPPGELPDLMLSGGGVTIDGDIDGDGKPDVTIRPRSSNSFTGFKITSSGNRLHALALEGFTTGVLLQPQWRPCCRGPGAFPSHQTFAGNVISDLVIRSNAMGVQLSSALGPGCAFNLSPCATYNTWTDTEITGNTIESPRGMQLGPDAAIGDRIEGLTVTGNTVRNVATAIRASEEGITVSQGGNSTMTGISDVLIAGNSIESVNGGGIVVASGMQRAQANTVDDVRIVDNRIVLVRQGSIHCCGFAIDIRAGADVWAPPVRDLRPLRYPDDNVIRNVEIAGNSVSGPLAGGVAIMAGTGGGSRNRIENVRVAHNVIHSTMMGKGVHLGVGDIFPFEGTYATANRITRVVIDANRITTGNGKPQPGETFRRSAGGIVLLSGWHYSRAGVVRDVRITNNRIATPHAGIRLIGGIGPTARGNRVSCVRLARNRVTGTRSAVAVTPNVDARPGEAPPPGRAKGNRASLGGC